MEQKWYQQTGVIVLALLFFFPIGLVLMWEFSSWRRAVKWAVTGLIAALFVVVIVSSAFSSDNEQADDEESVAAEVTSTAEATDTPEPTEQPEATDTPEATDPPEPTPLPELAQAECAYLLLVSGEYAAPMQESLSKFTDLSFDASSDPTLIFDIDWQANVVVELALWSVTRDRFSELTAPEELASFHQLFLDGLVKLDETGTLFAEGIDEINADKILQATAAMTEGTASLNQANDLLTSFRATHSGEC